MSAEPRPGHGGALPGHPSGPPPGLSVDGYELLTRIGEGGMGVVHLARRPGEPRVALKVLRPHVVGDEEARRRLAREVSSLARIRSTRVAEIVDSDPWGPIPYVATRYVPGLALDDHVREEGPIRGTDLWHFARCLAEALAAVHVHGVVHRDVKPANVLMEGRSPVLIDFGLARVADDPRLTHHGWLLGTPGYLAPEILYGDDATTASDIHSYGATLAFAGTGQPPFGRGPAVAVMDRVRRGEYVLDGLEPDLRRLVMACLAPAPAHRPSIAEILDRLAAPAALRDTPEPIEDVFTAPLALAALAGLPEATQPVTPTEVGGPERRAHDDWAQDDWAHDDWGSRDTQGHAARTAESAWAAYDEQRPWPTAPYSAAYPQQIQPQPPRLPKPVRARRTTLFVLLALALGAMIAAVPYVVSGALVVGAWLLRSGSLAGSAARNRRLARGGRHWFDGPRLLLGAPWHLLRSIPGTGLLVLWGIGFATAAGLFAYAFALSLPTALLVCGTAFALALGVGPGGRRVRGPIDRVVLPAAEQPARWLIGVAAVAVIGGLAASVAYTRGPDWTPAQDRPLANVSWGSLLR